MGDTVTLCPQCSTQVEIGGGSEGTRYYVNSDGSEHVCKEDEMPEDSWTTLRESKPALAYIIAYPLLRKIARECGYALALHGSLARDFDLIAVPWTREAIEPQALVQAICDKTDLRVTVPDEGNKPHGRGCWTLQGLAVRGSWIDLSVMPLADDRERLLALSTWQSTGTAPKDGTSILCALRQPGYKWEFDVIRFTPFGFWSDGYGDIDESDILYWMPLPAPPTEDTNASR